MPALPAPVLGLRDDDRERLTAWTRASSIRAGLAQRARIVLLAAEGVSNTEIAEWVGVSRTMVVSWGPLCVQRDGGAGRRAASGGLLHDQVVTWP